MIGKLIDKDWKNTPQPGPIGQKEWIQKAILERVASSGVTFEKVKLMAILRHSKLQKYVNHPPSYESTVREQVRSLIRGGFLKCDEPLEERKGIMCFRRELTPSAQIELTEDGKYYLEFLATQIERKKDEANPREVKLDCLYKIPSSLIGMLRERKGQYCLFIGAGASTSAGIPCGEDINNQILGRLYGKDLNEEVVRKEFIKEFKSKIEDQPLTLEMIFQGLIDKHGKPGASKVLRDELDGGLDPTPGYCSLAYLIKHGFFKVVFTVNLDELLEKGFEAELGKGQYNRICDRDEFESFPLRSPVENPQPLLVKLHGTYTLSSTLIVKWDEVQELPRKKADILQYYASNYPFLYVGYSARDPDIRTVLREAGKKSKHKIFWVSPYGPCDSVENLFNFFNSSLENHIKITADNFFDELEERLIGGYPRLKNEVSSAIHRKGAYTRERAINSEQVKQAILSQPSWGKEISQFYRCRTNRLKRDIEASLKSLIEEGFVECEKIHGERKYFD